MVMGVDVMILGEGRIRRGVSEDFGVVSRMLGRLGVAENL